MIMNERVKELENERMRELINKIRRKWMKLRLQPIHVYCFHHVCAEFDAESMYAEDWLQIDDFKRAIINMKNEGRRFISLTEAYKHIANDKFRNRKYIVLTFDDGYASLKEILPWLEEQHIPVSLFINGKYLDGKSYRETPKEQYLTYDELFRLTSPLIEIGSHGWEHIDATQMTEQEFATSVEKNIQLLSHHPRYIPFMAYTYGDYSSQTNVQLHNKNLIPIYVDGGLNYSDITAIHRELLKI